MEKGDTALGTLRQVESAKEGDSDSGTWLGKVGHKRDLGSEAGISRVHLRPGKTSEGRRRRLEKEGKKNAGKGRLIYLGRAFGFRHRLNWAEERETEAE